MPDLPDKAPKGMDRDEWLDFLEEAHEVFSAVSNVDRELYFLSEDQFHGEYDEDENEGSDTGVPGND